MTDDDHNSGQWLRVVYESGATGYLRNDGYWRQYRHRGGAGWVVIRTCPCHNGLRVTRRYDSEAEAWSAVGLMLAVSMTIRPAGRAVDLSDC
jgi:hypothetical protein